MTRRFSITWFMGAIHKYRRLLGEVIPPTASTSSSVRRLFHQCTLAIIVVALVEDCMRDC